MIMVLLESNRISVQGQHYLEFINSIVPDILERVNTLGNAHQVPDKKLITKPTQDRSVGKKFKSVDDPQHDQDGSVIAAEESKAQSVSESKNLISQMSDDIASIQASLQKLDINDLLQTVISNQNDINKRLNVMEAKFHSSSHLDIPSDLSTLFQNIFFYSSIKIYNEFTFNYTYLITLQHYRYDTMGSERQ